MKRQMKHSTRSWEQSHDCWPLLLLDAHGKYNTAEGKQSRRFLEWVEDNSLTQLVSEPTSEDAPLDLLFMNRGELVGDVVVGGHLGHGNHKMIEFSIVGEVRTGISKAVTLVFQRADFGLFRSLVDRVPGEIVLKGQGVQEGWTFFKGTGAGCPGVWKDKPARQKTSLAEQSFGWNSGKRKKVCHLWKKGQGTQEDYKNIVRLCKEKIRKMKAQLELRLASAIKDNKKCFYKYIRNERRAKDNLHPLLDGEWGNITTKDEEKAKVHNALFASVLNSKISYL